MAMEPIAYIAQGKLGSYEKNGKLFQVQTEFAHRPHPRVTSSVVLDGRIIHKADKEWPGDLATDEGRAELDAFIATQHKATMDLIVSRAGEFVDAPSATPASDGYDAPTIVDTIEEVLESVPYVIGLYEFDDAGAITHRKHFRDVVADWDREFVALGALVFGLPNIIRVGDFRYGMVKFGAENLITARIGNRAFGILTDPSATVEDLRRDFPDLFEAAFSANSTA